MQFKLRSREGFLSTFVYLVAATWSTTSLIACGKGDQSPAAPAVTVGKPLTQKVIDSDEYPGRLQSPQIVNLAARVSGLIESAPFEEGSLVRQGDILFVIDQRPFMADLASKEADVARADALVAQADARFKRYAKLEGTRAISAENYDDALATLNQAKASLKVALAALDISKLNLEWSKVAAPIDGRISRKFVTEGNLVTGGAGQGTPLTIITSVDPIYSYASIPERMLLQYQNLAKKLPTGARIPCVVQLENEDTFSRKGKIDFIDNRVDPNTGTVELRCTLPNPDGSLLSGLFAKVRIPSSEPYQALLIPDLAVGTDQNSKYALVIGKENKVESRSVKVGPLFGKLRSITDGLEPDDRVVVNGIQLARPGTKVTPSEAPIETESLAGALPPAPQATANEKS